MRTKSILTLVGVLAIIQAPCDAKTDQSEGDSEKNQPISNIGVGMRQSDAPEVVLQLKYIEGGLDKIYLTQFRKESKGWEPPVLARRSLCADLCYSGLGGGSCGTNCRDMMPVGLKTALLSSNTSDTLYGEPRVEVCPVLCKNGLGQPLCNCAEDEPEPVDWSAVCGTFCSADNYVLKGCPTCEDVAPQAMKAVLSSSRSLDTVEGWRSWCNVQCRQGQGGAACNCDRAPFQ
ncbi:uncharacterized protein LOC112053168 [Bicyclus anynana]|uniref:Uncharacterized protein LOC112053168 n=1 Tax=Bicyclus anynana TaxID=110368 RepID=A0ABM3LV41_BICAN|nr:uncharacterized protein LOC112053168 [Bicyclus anynana]